MSPTVHEHSIRKKKAQVADDFQTQPWKRFRLRRKSATTRWMIHPMPDPSPSAKEIELDKNIPPKTGFLSFPSRQIFTFQKWQHLNVSWIPGIPRPASQSPVLNRQHVLQRCQTLSTVRILSANCGVLYKENMFSDFPPSIVDPSVSALISAVWVVRRLRLGWAAKTENMPRVHTVKLSTVQWVCPCVIQG